MKAMSPAATPSTLNIGGIEAPIFSTRRADTYVTVRDGETVIIGGLITARESEGETKVPLVGDIPLLGNLFRSTSVNSTKTELLIVLTPHVVRTPEDSHALSVQLRDQTGLNDNIRTSPLMEKLRVDPNLPSNVEPGSPLTPVEKHERPGADAGGSDRVEEEIGPQLEEYGPSADMIRTGPAASKEPAIAVIRRSGQK